MQIKIAWKSDGTELQNNNILIETKLYLYNAYASENWDSNVK